MVKMNLQRYSSAVAISFIATIMASAWPKKNVNHQVALRIVAHHNLHLLQSGLGFGTEPMTFMTDQKTSCSMKTEAAGHYRTICHRNPSKGSQFAHYSPWMSLQLSTIYMYIYIYVYNTIYLNSSHEDASQLKHLNFPCTWSTLIPMVPCRICTWRTASEM